jgi:hypothetical protein
MEYRGCKEGIYLLKCLPAHKRFGSFAERNGSQTARAATSAYKQGLPVKLHCFRSHLLTAPPTGRCRQE